MAREVILRCDKCGETEGVATFLVAVDGDAREVDLCPKDARPLVKLHELGRPAEAAPKRGRKRAVHSVVPIEDLGIEEPK